ncbi:hypothetical protein ACHAP3_005821 [Botrytis cinerea]
MPSEYSFDGLSAIILSRFKEGPGHYQVSSGNYDILNGKNRKQAISGGYGERREFLPEHFFDRTGEAFIFSDVFNISFGKPEELKATTGLHIIRSIYCRVCATEVGWRYDRAPSDVERYKEGKYLLGTCLIQPTTELHERVKDISSYTSAHSQFLRQAQQQYDQMQRESDRQQSGER